MLAHGRRLLLIRLQLPDRKRRVSGKKVALAGLGCLLGDTPVRRSGGWMATLLYADAGCRSWSELDRALPVSGKSCACSVVTASGAPASLVLRTLTRALLTEDSPRLIVFLLHACYIVASVIAEGSLPSFIHSGHVGAQSYSK